MTSVLVEIALLQLPPGDRLAAASEIHVSRDRSRYTWADWGKALLAYQHVGLAEASAATGVPRRTLARWARHAGVTAGRPSSLVLREDAKYEAEIRSRPYLVAANATADDAAAWLECLIGKGPGERPWQRRSKHTVDRHANALRLYSQVGPREAARRSGVPLRTVARWAKAAGLAPPLESRERTTAATQARLAAIDHHQREAFAGIYGLNAGEVNAFITAPSLAEGRARLAAERRRLVAA